jgi:hypothetical protein
MILLSAEAAHEQSVRTSTADVASFLQDLLGQRIVAVIAGQKDPKQIGRWARGEHQPRPEAAQRLRQTYQVATLLLQAEDSAVAARWFRSMNPHLNDDEPAIALSENRGADVLRAARAFVANAGS